MLSGGPCLTEQLSDPGLDQPLGSPRGGDPAMGSELGRRWKPESSQPTRSCGLSGPGAQTAAWPAETGGGRGHGEVNTAAGGAANTRQQHCSDLVSRKDSSVQGGSSSWAVLLKPSGLQTRD